MVFFLVPDVDKNGEPIDMLDKYYYQYKDMLDTLDETKYDMFLERSLTTFDSYSIGATIFKLLHELDNKIPINKQLLSEIIILTKKMIHWNVFERITIKDAMSEYKTILHKHGLKVIENVHSRSRSKRSKRSKRSSASSRSGSHSYRRTSRSNSIISRKLSI